MNCCVFPSTIDGFAGVTAIETNVAAGAVTVSVTAVLVTPLALAVIWVVPNAMPVASPVLLLIVATFVALLDHVKATPVMVFPLASFAVAEN